MSAGMDPAVRELRIEAAVIGLVLFGTAPAVPAFPELSDELRALGAGLAVERGSRSSSGPGDVFAYRSVLAELDGLDADLVDVLVRLAPVLQLLAAGGRAGLRARMFELAELVGVVDPGPGECDG